ncbi:PH domain-containing protein [Candidatus Saccharibacteria bacterium]|nr:PH domain-containing protein [Candidatus Saccharibacteria bacterium]
MPHDDPKNLVDEELLVAGEHVVVIVRKHFIGLVFIYLQALVGMIAVLSIIFITSPDIFNNLDDQSNRLLVAVVLLGVALLVLYLFVATYVYRHSRLLVTDKNLIQINQKSLFIRKVSRLSMSNVEDVSADQRGILATIFNYGTLLIQTAGERPNFEFKYCPTPNHYADQVLEARQAFAEAVEE